jgi:hypothetical protein
MLRKRLVALCVLASAAFVVGVVTPSDAAAQEVMDLDEEAKKMEEAETGVVDLDEDAPEETGPVAAGQMTEQAAAAKKLFDREKWADAALALYRVVAGETGDDPGNQQLAQYYLAIALYRLKFYQASYAIFSVIADNRNHIKFNETLLWLAKLATQLPEPADIIERVGKYTEDQLARFDSFAGSTGRAPTTSNPSFLPESAMCSCASRFRPSSRFSASRRRWMRA